MSNPHTPGPWHWDGKFTVTIPHAQGDTAFRTNPEDARLIALAPDLLENARLVLKGFGGAFFIAVATEHGALP